MFAIRITVENAGPAAAQFREQSPVLACHVQCQGPQPEQRQLAIENLQVALAGLTVFEATKQFRHDGHGRPDEMSLLAGHFRPIIDSTPMKNTIGNGV